MHSPSHQYTPSSPWHPAAPPWQHAGVGSGFRRGRRRPSHQRSTAAPEHRPCLSSRSSERVRRRHDALHLQQRLSPAILSSATAGTCLERYIKGPRAPPSTHATSDTPRRASHAVDRPVVAVFLNSSKFGRRRNPVPFVAAICHRGNLPRALYKGSPSPSEHSRDFRHSP